MDGIKSYGNSIKETVKNAIGGTERAAKADNATSGLYGFKNGITGDEIRNINKGFGGTTELNGRIDTVLDSASRYDGFWNKTAATARSIVKNHTFDNGNKRTAQAVIEELMKRNGVSTGVNQSAIRDTIYKISTGQLSDVEDIAKALRGF